MNAHAVSLRHPVATWTMTDAEERWPKLLSTACAEAATTKKLTTNDLSLDWADS